MPNPSEAEVQAALASLSPSDRAQLEYQLSKPERAVFEPIGEHTEVAHQKRATRILWEEQIKAMDGIKGLLFWDGPRFDGATHRAAVYGDKAQLLAAFDVMMPLFDDMDIDV